MFDAEERIENLEKQVALLSRACARLTSINANLIDLIIDRKEGFLSKRKYINRLYDTLQELNEIQIEAN